MFWGYVEFLFFTKENLSQSINVIINDYRKRLPELESSLKSSLSLSPVVKSTGGLISLSLKIARQQKVPCWAAKTLMVKISGGVGDAVR